MSDAVKKNLNLLKLQCKVTINNKIFPLNCKELHCLEQTVYFHGNFCESFEMNSYSNADKNLGHNCIISTSHVGQYYYLITSLVENLHVLCLISDSKFLGVLIVFCSVYSYPANEVLFVSGALV